MELLCAQTTISFAFSFLFKNLHNKWAILWLSSTVVFFFMACETSKGKNTKWYEEVFRRTEHTNSIKKKKNRMSILGAAIEMAERFGSMCFCYICDIFCTNFYKLKEINCTTKTCAYIDEKSVYLTVFFLRFLIKFHNLTRWMDMDVLCPGLFIWQCDRQSTTIARFQWFLFFAF